MRTVLCLIALTSLWGRAHERTYPAWEELRVEIADLKFALNAARTEIEILEERLSKMEKDKVVPTLEVPSLEMIRRMEARLDLHEQKFREIVQLKETILALAKETAPASHRVQPGDSLEKIARGHRTSIEALKKLNDLKNDTIYVGQELKLPDACH